MILHWNDTPCSLTYGSSNLLTVGLQTTRNIEVNYVSYVRLVDTHTKRDGGNHDDVIRVHETVLQLGLRRRIHASMECSSIETLDF